METNRLLAVAATAVQKLRVRELRSGQPFLVHSQNLPQWHSYLEFPNGKITVVKLTEAGARDFTTVRELSAEEVHIIRREHNLPPLGA